MKRLKRIVRNTALVFLGVSIACFASLALLLEPRVPVRGFAELDLARLTVNERNVVIFDGNNEKIDLSGFVGNKRVSLSTLPAYVPNAFIAVEDKRFYSHKGVDPYRMAGAAIRNLAAGSFKEGASTITQQLVKNTHLKNEKTLSRKIQEIRIARDLERRESKEKIMETYLGVLYFGNNAYGIDGAARLYFGKSAKKLTLAESATLAGVINSPAIYDPFENPGKCVERRNLVLKKMFENGFISEKEYETAKSAQLVTNGVERAQNQFVNACINEACTKTGLGKDELLNKNVVIRTAYDEKLQNKVTDIIERYSASAKGEISVVVLDKNCKFVSYASTAKSDVSFVKRQPASTLKPLLCYAPAIERGVVYPCTPVLDEPCSFGSWTVKNYKNKYYGWTDVETGLILSLNVPAVKLLDAVGTENAKAVCSRTGIEFSPRDNSLALALGSTENGVSLPALCGAYAVLRDGGAFRNPCFVTKMELNDGNCVYRTASVGKRALSPETSYLVTDMLVKCARVGTAKKVGFSGGNVAAKTGTAGTTDGNTDAYCVAYSPCFTVAVRVSAGKTLLPNNVAGGTVPAKICKEIFRYLGDESKFTVPCGVVKAQIDIGELKENKKVLLAGKDVPAANRKEVLFSRYNMPRVYSSPDIFTDEKTELDDFDNFKIIDRFFD